MIQIPELYFFDNPLDLCVWNNTEEKICCVIGMIKGPFTPSLKLSHAKK